MEMPGRIIRLRVSRRLRKTAADQFRDTRLVSEITLRSGLFLRDVQTLIRDTNPLLDKYMRLSSFRSEQD